MSDIFVFKQKEIHIYTRLGGLIFGIITYNKGIEYNDNILKNMGIATIIVDAYTFYLSLQRLGFKI